MESRIGQRIGNYRIIHLLGKGGFASVYLGEHIHLKSYAAIKILHNSISHSDGQNFVKEGRIIASLNHPNILRVFDFDIHPGLFYLAMEYAPKGTLRQRHPYGSILPIATVLSYVQQIAGALQYAHDQNVVHRDVKPENMLLSEGERVLVSDFGIASIVSDTTSASNESITGTVFYMAPEQLMGRVVKASDQYALGVVVYEWLCGAPPFTGNFMEIAFRHTNDQPPSLREKILNFPPAIEEVVMKALAKKPEDRFSTIRDFAQELEQASLSIIQPTSPVSPVSRPNAYSLSGPSLPYPSQDREESEPTLRKEPTNFSQKRGEPSQAQNTLEDEPCAPTEERSPGTTEDEPLVFVQEMGGGTSKSLELPHAQTAAFPDSALLRDERSDFFISYNGTDRGWALWLATWLREAGYSVLLPPVDFRAGFVFKNEMQKALSRAKQMIVTLTPAYLAALKARSSGFHTFKHAAAHKQESLLSVCVHSHDAILTELSGITNYIDLSKENATMARAIFLAYIRDGGIELLPSNAHVENAQSFLQAFAPTIYPDLDTLPTPSGIFQQATSSFAKKDWPDVTRKIDFLLKKRPEIITAEMCRMQGLAFLELEQEEQAYEAFKMALTLASDQQRLVLLEDCVKVLTMLGRWGEVLAYTEEVSQLAASTAFWAVTRKQAIAHLARTRPSPQQATTRKQHMAAGPSPQSIKVFFSYSHKDTEMRQELETHLSNLKRQSVITGWHDGEIRGGDVWEEEIEAHLRSAQIILLLISPDFINSDYCYEKEMLHAMERHRAGEAHVIPIILRPAHWEHAPFGKLQALPPGAKALTLWPNRDEAFMYVAKGIQKIVDGLTRDTAAETAMQKMEDATRTMPRKASAEATE